MLPHTLASSPVDSFFRSSRISSIFQRYLPFCWVPGCLRPRAPLGTDPLCAVDSLSFSLLLSFSSPSYRKQ
ncbi:hypothetical protein ACN42_g11790 [Penicillium freii]|uniref:Uncharacterized protein n=1 Tax=Penicillium freii TaxID=48697 RepID=A0A101M7P1_PENFR|nr:hypothetical protein ACN42_g11790 [Penicillium freii]